MVQLLIEQGIEVTLATREDDFGNDVKRITVDREDAQALFASVKGKSYDVVYDQVCYAPNEAIAACDIFDGLTDQYILTSTMAVYDMGDRARTEDEFNPHTYPLLHGGRGDFEYGIGKRLAEAALFQIAAFPVTAVRIPVVMGPDDYTGRLRFHIEQVIRQQTFALPNPESRQSFIHAEECSRFLVWLANHSVVGPINACANGTVLLREMMGRIEDVVGQKAVYVTDSQHSPKSPFGISGSYYMDNMKAKHEGFVFSELMEWLPQLIRAEVLKIQ